MYPTKATTEDQAQRQSIKETKTEVKRETPLRH